MLYYQIPLAFGDTILQTLASPSSSVWPHLYDSKYLSTLRSLPGPVYFLRDIYYYLI